ncbi:MAG TPA: aminotransferase class V-fold PLP-dependent enzyme [Streptosporangiaceae bacterium]|nr:aminotransferase class V-fold PLP-dependent enzyme [Streptosporangiaceae bacterium]
MTGLPDASAWALDPAIAHLNHGGFGAVPSAVLARQQAWRDAMERNPTGFLIRELPALLGTVRAEVAAFLGADEEGVVFIENATAGTQTVIAQIKLGLGDEVLVTDHCYPAVLAQLRRVVSASGAILRVVPVPIPCGGSAAVAEAVVSGLSDRTRLVALDHVASCSGLVFPVAQIVAECRARSVPVLVDGAHAAGMLPVDAGALGADFWVGNLHKWVSAPKSSAVLYAAPAWRDTLRPLIASHGFADGYQPAFGWTGTRDPSAVLAVPAALAFFAAAGWPAIRQHNYDLAREGAALIADRIGTSSPAADGLAGSMRLVRLPRPLAEADARALEGQLFERYGVVVPATCHGGWQWLRVSAQLYNTRSDYERLAAALIELGVTNR